jgi:hypothetical protein
MIESRIKHLEMIQTVIARLAGHSFAIKGVAVTLTSALIGAAAGLRKADLAIVALLPIVTCWGLDGHYLRLERLFRAHFDEVRTRAAGSDEFSMKPSQAATDSTEAYVNTLCSPTLRWLYVPICVAVLLFWVISR